MKIKIENYTFNKSTKQITFSDYASIRLDAILLITNATDSTIIFNFADPTKGGTISGNILTLSYDTSSMDNNDKLLIYYDDSTKAELDTIGDEISNKDLMIAIKNLLWMIANPTYIDKTANQIRSQVTGSVTATVSSTSLVNIDSMQGRLLMMNSNINAWSNSQRRTIS